MSVFLHVSCLSITCQKNGCFRHQQRTHPQKEGMAASHKGQVETWLGFLVAVGDWGTHFPTHSIVGHACQTKNPTPPSHNPASCLVVVFWRVRVFWTWNPVQQRWWVQSELTRAAYNQKKQTVADSLHCLGSWICALLLNTMIKTQLADEPKNQPQEAEMSVSRPALFTYSSRQWWTLNWESRLAKQLHNAAFANKSYQSGLAIIQYASIYSSFTTFAVNPIGFGTCSTTKDAPPSRERRCQRIVVVEEIEGVRFLPSLLQWWRRRGTCFVENDSSLTTATRKGVQQKQQQHDKPHCNIYYRFARCWWSSTAIWCTETIWCGNPLSCPTYIIRMSQRLLGSIAVPLIGLGIVGDNEVSLPCTASILRPEFRRFGCILWYYGLCFHICSCQVVLTCMQNSRVRPLSHY